MTNNSTVTTFNQLAPIIIQQYENYLPTAFSDDLTMLQKVNKIIQSITTTNTTVNSLIDEWNNTIVPYVNGDGFQTDVNNKLDSMASDGTLKQLLDNTVLSYEIYMSNYQPLAAETNDTGRFQRALNDLVANGGGRLVLEKNTTYVTTSDLTWESNNIQIISPYGTILKPTNCNGFNYGDSTGANRYNYTSIVGLSIDLSNAIGYTGIISNNADETYITDVKITNGGIGINLNGSYNVSLINVLCISQTTKALVTDCTDKLLVVRGQYGNGNKGIHIQGGKGITLIGLSIERNNDEAITIDSSMTRGGEYPQGINIIGCYFERNCMVTGSGYINYGVYNANIGDYSKDIVVQGNYFNWDINNPRTPTVPFHFTDRISETTFISNRYSNSSNISSSTSNTYINSVLSLNDSFESGRGIPTAPLKQLWTPFNVTVPTDTNGHGVYNYDTTGLELTDMLAIGNFNGNNFTSSSILTFVYTGGTNVAITVDGCTPSSNVEVTGLIMGHQK